MMYRRRFLVALLVLLLAPLEGCWSTGGGSGSAGGSGGTMVVKAGTCKVTFKTETKSHAEGTTVSIPMGALLETDAKGLAVVNWGRTSQILHPNTKLTYVAESTIPGYGVSKVDLLRGLGSFFLPKNDTPEFKFQASCHSIVAAVKGTGFDMSAEGDDGTVVVATTRGTVYTFARDGDKMGAELATVETGDVYATAETTSQAASAPNASPVRSGVMALFNKPVASGLNKALVSNDNIGAWDLTREVLTKHFIATF